MTTTTTTPAGTALPPNATAPNPLRTVYYLASQDRTVGVDESDYLKARWEAFAAAHPEIEPHTSNGVTKWLRDGLWTVRIIYRDAAGFHFHDETMIEKPR